MWKTPIQTPITFNWPDEDILTMFGVSREPKSRPESKEESEVPNPDFLRVQTDCCPRCLLIEFYIR